MQVHAWMEYPLSISGIWLVKHYILQRINFLSRETFATMSNQENLPTRERRNTPTRMFSNRSMSIMLLQTHNFLTSAPCFTFSENEAVIKMIMKGRCPTMRHVSRTHRVAHDWLFDRINLDPKIQIKHIDTKNQLADILTKCPFHT